LPSCSRKLWSFARVLGYVRQYSYDANAPFAKFAPNFHSP